MSSESYEFTEFLNSYKRVRLAELTENNIYSEICWVVYSAGFRYKVVRKYWPSIARALHYFDVAKAAKLDTDLESAALEICKLSNFKNVAKAKWCVMNARRLQELSQDSRFPDGLKGLLTRLSEKPSSEIIELAPTITDELNLRGIGPTTIFHLLKNLGIDVFKPDRHLRRLLCEFRLTPSNASTSEICYAMEKLSVITGMSLSEIDSTLFFYGQSHGDVLVQNHPGNKTTYDSSALDTNTA